MKTAEHARLPVAARRLIGPLLLLLFVTGIVLLLPRFGVPVSDFAPGPDGKTPVERHWGALAIGIAGALVLARLLDYFFFDLLFRLRRKPTAPALLRQILGLLLFGLCLAILFQSTLHVSLTAVLATSAIITAVIGLALQDTLGNLFSGLALHMEKTVQVGDMVRAGEIFGTVEELSWRAIKLRTMESNIVLIPNSLASRERLEVFRRPGRPVARTMTIRLELETPPARARELLVESARNLPGIAAYPEPVALVKEIGETAIVYELRYWLEDYSRFLDLDSQIRERVWYRLDRADVRIAYPVIRQHQWIAGPLPPRDRGQGIPASLERLALLSPLSPAERQKLAAGAKERRYGPGETVVREGETSSSMFVVQQGQLAVSIHGAQGDTRKLAMLQPGDAFGEISLLTGEPRTATVRSLTEAALIEITKETFAPILEANPSLVESLSAVMRERRQKAADLYDASRAEQEKEPERSVLGARIARFFGIKLRG
ncbi:MAG: cyclic nucleotide-binding domain-containing protein [Thermoanaerobaculia bacterium]